MQKKRNNFFLFLQIRFPRNNKQCFSFVIFYILTQISLFTIKLSVISTSEYFRIHCIVELRAFVVITLLSHPCLLCSTGLWMCKKKSVFCGHMQRSFLFFVLLIHLYWRAIENRVQIAFHFFPLLSLIWSKSVCILENLQAQTLIYWTRVWALVEGVCILLWSSYSAFKKVKKNKNKKTKSDRTGYSESKRVILLSVISFSGTEESCSNQKMENLNAVETRKQKFHLTGNLCSWFICPEWEGALWISECFLFWWLFSKPLSVLFFLSLIISSAFLLNKFLIHSVYPRDAQID